MGCVVHFPMRRTRVRLSVASLLVAATLATACTQEPLKFNTIQLGRGLNADKTVSGFTTRFKPSDTIYAAVLTEGAGAGKVKARWLYAGRVVSEPQRDVTYQGPASTEFHIQNTSGFPPGEYTVNCFSTESGRLQVLPRRDQRPQGAIHLSQHDAKALSWKLTNDSTTETREVGAFTA